MRLIARARHRPLLRRPLVLAATGAVLLAGLGGAGWWLERSGLVARAAALADAHAVTIARNTGLTVGALIVEGRVRVSPDAVLAAAGVRRGMPILDVDLNAAKTRLEAMAFVRSAEVERRLPDTIYIRLVERQPLAFWQRQGQLVLIDPDGKVLATDHLDEYGGLIVLVGEDAPQRGAALLEMLAGEPQLMHHVAAAVRVGGRRWNLRLDNGIDVALPEQDAATAWHRLATLERGEGLLERAITEVDLRLPDRLVVRLPTEPQKPATPAKKGKPNGKPT
jgi:cell division protein FtsQ